MALPHIACCAAPTWQPLQLDAVPLRPPPWDVLLAQVNDEWPDDAQCVACDLRSGWQCIGCGALFFKSAPEDSDPTA